MNAIKDTAYSRTWGRPIYRWSTDSPLRSMSGELTDLALFAGQVSDQIRRIVPAAERIESMVLDAERVVRGLGRLDQ